MGIINSLFNTVFGALLAPFDAWPTLLTLIVWSAVIGVVMSVVFRYTSNQRALKVVADQSRANLLAIKLFQDNLTVTLWCQLALMRSVGLRLWHSLPPMIVMTVPFVFVLVQFGVRYEYRPLRVGEPAVVELRLNISAWEAHRDVQIEVPAAVDVQTPALRDEEKHTVYWRVTAKEPEPFTIRWRLGDVSIEKQVAVSDRAGRLTRVSVQRPGPVWLDRLLHPVEPAFAADSPVRAVVVHHDRLSTPVLGFDVPWWLTLLVVSCVSALLVKPLVKVQF